MRQSVGVLATASGASACSVVVYTSLYCTADYFLIFNYIMCKILILFMLYLFMDYARYNGSNFW